MSSCHSRELLVLFGSFLVSLLEMAKCWNQQFKKTSPGYQEGITIIKGTVVQVFIL